MGGPRCLSVPRRGPPYPASSSEGKGFSGHIQRLGGRAKQGCAGGEGWLGWGPRSPVPARSSRKTRPPSPLYHALLVGDFCIHFSSSLSNSMLPTLTTASLSCPVDVGPWQVSRPALPGVRWTSSRFEHRAPALGPDPGPRLLLSPGPCTPAPADALARRSPLPS